MKIAVFKQHFYKYISKAEFAMATSAVIGTLATNFVTGYSSYLSDRNDRIERLNKKPLNHIYINYISFEDYQKITDRRNWKPASLRPKQVELPEKHKTIKKEQLIKKINEWLANNTKKNNKNEPENEVSIENLQQLAQDNSTSANNVATLSLKQPDKEITKNNTDDPKTETYIKISDQNNKNLPPIPKKQEEPIKYFVVQDGVGGKRYKPEDYRRKHAKQRLQLSTNGTKKPIGTIAGQEIEKDDNIFQSILSVFRTIFFIKADKKNQIINSNYDQYGNRITNTEEQQEKKNEESKIKNFIANIINTNKKEIQNQQEEEQIDFVFPTFHIDGNLQKMTEYNKFKEIATVNNLNAFELQTLSYLEYAFEDCWHKQYSNKYGNNYIDALFSVAYKENGDVYEIKLEKLTTKLNKTKQQMFKNDIVNLLTSCDITEIKNLSKDNYRLWGKIKIKFTKN